MVNGWNVIYKVDFDCEGCENMSDTFDSRDEAIEYAKEHLDKNPIVTGKSFLVDSDDNIVAEEESEVLFKSSEEQDEDSATDTAAVDSDLEARLAKLMHSADDEVPCDPDHDECEQPVVIDSEDKAADDIVVQVEEPTITVDPIEAPAESDNPFDTDFSETDEVIDKDDLKDAVEDYFEDLIKQLGLEDELEVKSVDDDDEDKDDKVEDEEPAEEIAKCEVCPECGKEICEEGKQEEPLLVQQAIPCDVELKGADCADHVCDKQPLIAHDDDTVKDLKKLNEEDDKKCSKCSDAKLDVEATMDLVDGEADKHADEEEAIVDAVAELSEDTHASEPKPEMDKVKDFNTALKVAKEKGKPVIYGYFGSDKHGDHRYFSIDLVVCDDLRKCAADIMKQFHPSGSVLVAYPDKDFIEEGITEECSDKEFAESFYKALKEKNCNK